MELTDWLARWEGKARKRVNKLVKPYQKPWYSKALLDLKNKCAVTSDLEISKKLSTAYVNATRSAKKAHLSNLAKKMGKCGGLLRVLGQKDSDTKIEIFVNFENVGNNNVTTDVKFDSSSG